ncbi:MAG: ABC transporter ATP-binding protein [Rickettsiales bacterium]
MNKNLQYIILIAKRFKWYIIGIFFAPTLHAFSAIYEPYLIKLIINKSIQITPETSSLLVPLILQYIILTTFVSISFRLTELCYAKFQTFAKNYIFDDLLARLMNQSIDFFNNEFSGSLVNKIKDASSGIPDLISSNIQKIYYTCLSMIIASFGMYSINIKYFYLFIIWIFSMCCIAFIFNKKVQELCEAASIEKSRVVGAISDIVTNIYNVILFASQKFEQKNLQPKLEQKVKVDLQRDYALIKLFFCNMFAIMIYISLCFYFLLNDFANNLITPGDFSLVFGINIAMGNVMWNFSENIALLLRNFGEVTESLNTMLRDPEIINNEDGDLNSSYNNKFDIQNFSYSNVNNETKLDEDKKFNDKILIEFKNVCFAYKKSKEKIFNNLSLQIKQGEIIGLVGKSGSGKSTFINLLLRLYDLQNGEILINNFNISKISQENLRKSIAIIPQDPSLFHRSIADNIKYAAPKASLEQVINAAKAGCAHEFIEKLPLGYETQVGERGIKLSGGQRQRISISRAILKNAPILILDEATSALDSITETKIQLGLLNSFQNKTVIIIAHRLSTLANVHRILVFDSGQIIEQGTHEQLIKLDGKYKELWLAQKNGFI